MMTRKMLVGILVLAACSAGAAYADITLNGSDPVLAVTQDSKAALSFRMEVGRIQTLDINTKGGLFTRLVIPGFHASQIEGSPELPMMNRLLSIPAGATTQVDVSNVVTRRVKLADFGAVHPLLPAQPSLSKSADPAQVAFVYDPAAYRKAEVRQDPVRIVRQGRLRAMDIGRLEISPVAYYPADGEIEVIESMDVSISFEGGEAQAATDLVARTWSPFFEHIYAGLAGAKGFHDGYPDRVGDVVTMVVVTPPMFAAQMQDFVAWKTERGFRMILAVTGTPEVGNTTAQIQAYLHGLYNSATPELPAPSFVLFVGDVAEMPDLHAGRRRHRPSVLRGRRRPGAGHVLRPLQRHQSQPAAGAAGQDDDVRPVHHARSVSYLDEVTLIAGVDGTWAPDPRQRADQLRHDPLLQRRPRADQQHLPLPALQHPGRGRDHPVRQRRPGPDQLHRPRQRDHPGPTRA